MTDPKNILINSAMIFVGAYYLPASVLFGALVGASIFIAYRPRISILRRLMLFAVSFVCGVFAGQDAAGIFNRLTPEAVQIGEFAGAVLAAALSVSAIEAIFWMVEHRSLNFFYREPNP